MTAKKEKRNARPRANGYMCHIENSEYETKIDLSILSDQNEADISKYHKKLHGINKLALSDDEQKSHSRNRSMLSSIGSVKSFIDKFNQSQKRNSAKNSKNVSKKEDTQNIVIRKYKKGCCEENCECWIRLKNYCATFKMDYSEVEEDFDINQTPKITRKNRKRFGSRGLVSEMTVLWEHYLCFHLGERHYSECSLNALCLFIKEKKNNVCDHVCDHYKDTSWNLLQTMHVYFYHNEEYIQCRNSRARKDRYIQQKTSCKILGNENSKNKQASIRQPTRPRIQRTSNIFQSYITRNLAHVADKIKVHGIETKNDDNEHNVEMIDKATELIPTDINYAIQYQSTTESLSFRVLEFGSPFIAEKSDAKYKDIKTELLNNTFCKMINKEWNDLLRACNQYSIKKNGKEIGLNKKEMIALKCYTDFNKLQSEYRKCYRENEAYRLLRQQQFYHWNKLLFAACLKSKDIITETLYDGVNEVFKTPSYSGTYYGPISTTTEFFIAKRFAGDDGIIFELYPTFGRKGLRVSWLSNYPDEKEVLYMNTSFQIVNMYQAKVNMIYTDHFVANNNNNNARINEDLFEQSILKALHVINTESNVISFSNMQDISPVQDLAFHELNEHEQVTILYLLYLQYTKDWDALKNIQQYKRIAFTKYRDQFVVLAKNVKAVKMERLPMLIQHFFYSDIKRYTFPFQSGDIDVSLQSVKHQFIKNKPLKFETITRLFPNAQQLLINGNNFDWTLEMLIKFMTNYDLEGVSLQEIQIAFIPQYPAFDEKYKANEYEAQARLTKAKSHKNITKIRRLGWIFETPCHLRRIGFEPLPELPFLLAFKTGHNEIFYRTYSRQILNRPALISSQTRDIRESVTLSTFQEDASITKDGIIGAYLRKSESSKQPGADDDEKYASNIPNNVRIRMPSSPSLAPIGAPPTAYSNIVYGGRNISNLRNNNRLNLAISFLKGKTQKNIMSVQLSTSNSSSQSDSITPSPSSFTPFVQQSYEGINPVVLGYNPKNCILSRNVVDKLEYKKILIETLFWRLKHPKLKLPKDKTKKIFIGDCLLVQVLVIDPITPELETLFMVNTNNKKPIISLDNIYKLFPNCTDIFLRNTQLNLRIGYRIKTFVDQNPNEKMERIFFCKNLRIRDTEIDQLKEILKGIGYGFEESEQMVCKIAT